MIKKLVAPFNNRNGFFVDSENPEYWIPSIIVISLIIVVGAGCSFFNSQVKIDKSSVLTTVNDTVAVLHNTNSDDVQHYIIDQSSVKSINVYVVGDSNIKHVTVSKNYLFDREELYNGIITLPDSKCN